MTIEELKAAGGEEWQNGGKHMITFNVQALSRLINLEVEHNDTGRVICGRLNGRPLSI